MKAMNDNKVARWQILMDRVEDDLLQVQAALANITEKRNNLSDEAAKLNRMKVDYLEGFQRGSAEPQLKAKTVFIKDFVLTNIIFFSILAFSGLIFFLIFGIFNFIKPLGLNPQSPFKMLAFELSRRKLFNSMQIGAGPRLNCKRIIVTIH